MRGRSGTDPMLDALVCKVYALLAIFRTHGGIIGLKRFGSNRYTGLMIFHELGRQDAPGP